MKFISSHALIALLQKILNDEVLYAPVLVGGVALYQEVEHVDDIFWDFTRTVTSVKEVVYPQTETLMVISENGNNISVQENISNQKSVVFGVRSCDARGMQTLDAMFLHTDPIDRYYAARRENAVLIGLSCSEMLETCFCTSMGGGPDDPSGMDIMLTAVEGGYLVEIMSDAGAKLLEGIEISEKAIDKPEPPIQSVVDVPEVENIQNIFASNVWMREGERCLSCRICAYVCPTCRCFDIKDESMSSANGDNQSFRLRCWDSCSSHAYRQIAGGHNPREIKADRLRNRILCKLKYYAEQYDGPLACTGCGRCISACPVNIDITEIMGALLEVEAI